jgi:UDP-galactopyranose mutase
MKQYDFLIVGAGLFGAVFAEQAKKNNKKCLVIDKRSHIAGNCYTEKKDDIDIHKYGPHIFHTNNTKIWEYVNQFASFNNYINRPKVFFENKIFSFPINLFTLHQLWGVKSPEEAKQKLENVRIKNENPQNLEEWILDQVGLEIYEKFIYGYTKKQWNSEPKDLPKFIIKRLPIRLSYDDNYFFDKYQGIPTQGYTGMIQNMLDGVKVELEQDYFEKQHYWDSLAKNIVYTGHIDKFFQYSFGNLSYRSLKFETQKLLMSDYQGNAIINYTDYDIKHTRIIEHKHFNIDSTKNNDLTYVTKEYPQNYVQNENEPFYPINNESNTLIYEKYFNITKKIRNKYIFGGRLAEYRYYDMHQVIGSALHKYEQINE